MSLLLAFVFFLVVQIYFYAFVFRKYTGLESEPSASAEHFNEQANSRGITPATGVSIVVCAFNEADHLKRHLKNLSEQNYSNYEIILVDDGSADETYKIIKKFKEDYNSENRPIRVFQIPPSDSAGKKHALGKGIAMAGKELILLTDADCTPNSPDWITRMVSGLDGPFEIVLGYGAYRKLKGSLLNKLIRYETLMTALQYFSYALQGQAYMGVGRNLAYKKSLFNEAGGFQSHLNVRSGDDDLFINQVATSENTGICDHPDAFTVSEPERKLTSWMRQKRRHITTSQHYKTRQKIKLGAFYISQLVFYVGATVLLILKTAPLIVSGLILLRFAVFYSTIAGAAKKLQEKDLVAPAPLYEISIIFMQLYVFIANAFSPPKKW